MGLLNVVNYKVIDFLLYFLFLFKSTNAKAKMKKKKKKVEKYASSAYLPK